MIEVTIANVPQTKSLLPNIVRGLYKAIASLTSVHKIKFVVQRGETLELSESGEQTVLKAPCIVSFTAPADLSLLQIFSIGGLLNEFLCIHDLVQNSQVFCINESKLLSENGQPVATGSFRRALK